jgi:hypothetical protein
MLDEAEGVSFLVFRLAFFFDDFLQQLASLVKSAGLMACQSHLTSQHVLNHMIPRP